MTTAKKPKLTASDIINQSNSTQVPTKPKELLNRFCLVLDASGSMEWARERVVALYNNHVSSIQKASVTEGQRSTISLVTFGERGDFTQPYGPHVKLSDQPVSRLCPITTRDYAPYGQTPMLDGIGVAIKLLEGLPGSTDENTSNVIIVITDGEENASKQFHPEHLNKKILGLQHTDRWSFAFLVPPRARESFARRWNIPLENIKEWDQTAKGIQEASSQLDQAVQTFTADRSAGKKSTRTFFADATKISYGDLNALSNVMQHVKSLAVGAEARIDEFVAAQGMTFETGRGYYQLTKTEKLQPYKKCMFRKRGERSVYAGTAADLHRLLQIPDQGNGDIRIKPGNLADFEVFIQSTSNNRKLVRGTTLIWDLR